MSDELDDVKRDAAVGAVADLEGAGDRAVVELT